ncbi:MAG: hypothetical protein Q7R86_02750 [bacterium]|nr:hypothetical protein [bacterium]
MDSENRSCQNCKIQFTIEPEDFQFYAKIQVPPPTFCPECRLQRRLAFRNERSLYKRKCDLCHKDIISMYADSTPFPVYCHNCWFSDQWDPRDYGQDYDFSKPFFAQFHELFKKVPRSALYLRKTINSPYSNLVGESKNVYLAYSIVNAENVFYSKIVDKSYYVYDSLSVAESENCYGNIYSDRNFNSHFLEYSNNCIDSWFLFDCINCKNCVLSSNLRNKEYFIRNERYSKEDYFKKLKELNFGSYLSLQNIKAEFTNIKLKAIHKYADILKSTRASGDNLYATKNAKLCFDSYEIEDCSYCFRIIAMKDGVDCCFTGLGAELIYEYISGGKGNYDLKFSSFAFDGVKNSHYTDYCQSSSELFGCIGLRGKKSSILNKQYDEADYRELLPKIKKHMEEMPFTGNNGRVYKYGEFFPIELSPFAYNETIAQEYFPIDKDRTQKIGYTWKEFQSKTYEIEFDSENLPDHIDEVDEKIIGKTISCTHQGKCDHQCTYGFRLIQEEFQLYKKLNIAVPRVCPNCRHYERLKLTNPLKLWKRQCMCLPAGTSAKEGDYKTYNNSQIHSHHPEGQCPNKFETSYAPERQETIYCEACYNAEVV